MHYISTDTDEVAEIYTKFTLSSSKQHPTQITVDVDNCPLLRELNKVGITLNLFSNTSHKWVDILISKNQVLQILYHV